MKLIPVGEPSLDVEEGVGPRPPGEPGALERGRGRWDPHDPAWPQELARGTFFNSWD